MAKEFETLSAKIPKQLAEGFEKFTKKAKLTKSMTVKKLVEKFLEENQAPLYHCDYCKKPISTGELYYCKLVNRERIKTTRKGKRVVCPEDSVTLNIYCEKCAKKHKFANHFTKKRKSSHRMHDSDLQIQESERET